MHKSNHTKWKKGFITISSISFAAVIFSIGLNWYLYNGQVKQHEEILQAVPKGSTVVSPYHIIFNTYKDYQIWNAVVGKEPEQSIDINITYTKSLNVDYAIIRVPRKFLAEEFIPPKHYKGYILSKSTDNYFLYAKENINISNRINSN